jgi:hypothetical protein
MSRSRISASKKAHHLLREGEDTLEFALMRHFPADPFTFFPTTASGQPDCDSGLVHQRLQHNTISLRQLAQLFHFFLADLSTVFSLTELDRKL